MPGPIQAASVIPSLAVAVSSGKYVVQCAFSGGWL